MQRLSSVLTLVSLTVLSMVAGLVLGTVIALTGILIADSIVTMGFWWTVHEMFLPIIVFVVLDLILIITYLFSKN